MNCEKVHNFLLYETLKGAAKLKEEKTLKGEKERNIEGREEKHKMFENLSEKKGKGRERGVRVWKIEVKFCTI